MSAHTKCCVVLLSPCKLVWQLAGVLPAITLLSLKLPGDVMEMQAHSVI